MASSPDSGDLASDIITYVGVPIAVAGLLPILWTSVATFITWRKIKAKLQRNNLPAETRSDPITRTIEVQYAKYVITPSKRLGRGASYRKLGLPPAELPRVCHEDNPDYIAGGTWTILKWETQQIGNGSQRVQYAKELRQPQAEVNFQQLVAYLYDLGAVPDKTGWTKLLSNGLWTAPKTPLLNSPRDSRKPLLVTAPFDHSDGHLSLALTRHWADKWDPPQHSSVPPYSIRLPASQVLLAGNVVSSTNPVPTSSASVTKATDEKTACGHDEKKVGLLDLPGKNLLQANIICEISEAGLSDVYEESLETDTSPDTYDSLPWGHLRIRKGKPNDDGIWFASVATACGISKDTILWKYKIPKDVLDFAAASTIPCGVIELLGFVDGSETPSWTSPRLTQEHERLASSRRIADQVAAERAERGLPVDERLVASRARQDENYRREMNQREDQKLREDQARGDRVRDALRSPTWSAARVAEHSLVWLQSREQLCGVSTVKDAVLVILRQMVLERNVSGSICEALARWKDWAEKGGMRLEDLNHLDRSPETFAKATLLVATIMVSTTQYEDVVLDLEECVNSWEIVRLG